MLILFVKVLIVDKLFIKYKKSFSQFIHTFLLCVYIYLLKDENLFCFQKRRIIKVHHLESKLQLRLVTQEDSR